jgi:hypothetical protein
MSYFQIPFESTVRIQLTSEGYNYYNKEWAGKAFTYLTANRVSLGPAGSLDPEPVSITLPSVNYRTGELDLPFGFFLEIFAPSVNRGFSSPYFTGVVCIPRKEMIEYTFDGSSVVAFELDKRVADRLHDLLQDVLYEYNIEDDDADDALTALRLALEDYENKAC